MYSNFPIFILLQHPGTSRMSSDKGPTPIPVFLTSTKRSLQLSSTFKRAQRISQWKWASNYKSNIKKKQIFFHALTSIASCFGRFKIRWVLFSSWASSAFILSFKNWKFKFLSKDKVTLTQTYGALNVFGPMIHFFN